MHSAKKCQRDCEALRGRDQASLDGCHNVDLDVAKGLNTSSWSLLRAARLGLGAIQQGVIPLPFQPSLKKSAGSA
jgi:hypothetical protein